MGYFLRDYYPDSVVAANDIGAVAYYGNIYLIDLVGLGNQPVARARLARSFDTAYMQELTTNYHVDIVIIYDSWFRDLIPSAWVKIATWEIPNNIVAGDRTVTFYAPSTEKEAIVRDKLIQFSPHLPPDVKVEMF